MNAKKKQTKTTQTNKKPVHSGSTHPIWTHHHPPLSRICSPAPASPFSVSPNSSAFSCPNIQVIILDALSLHACHQNHLFSQKHLSHPLCRCSSPGLLYSPHSSWTTCWLLSVPSISSHPLPAIPQTDHSTVLVWLQVACPPPWLVHPLLTLQTMACETLHSTGIALFLLDTPSPTAPTHSEHGATSQAPMMSQCYPPPPPPPALSTFLIPSFTSRSRVRSDITTSWKPSVTPHPSSGLAAPLMFPPNLTAAPCTFISPSTQLPALRSGTLGHQSPSLYLAMCRRSTDVRGPH